MSDKDSAEHFSKLNALLATLAAIVGAAAALGALFAPSGSAAAVAIGCGILAIIGFTLNIKYRVTRKSIAVGTGLLLAVTAASGGAAITKSLQQTYDPYSPNRRGNLPALSISLQENQKVPWCISALTGRGRIPAGYSLLIFDREVSPNDQASSTAEYSLDGPVKSSGGTWSLSPIYIGEKKVVKNFYVELTGILVNARIAAFITAIQSHGWGTLVLPPGLESIHAFVQRTSDLTQCA